VQPQPCLCTAQPRPRPSVGGVGGARNGTVEDAKCVSVRRPLPGTMERKRSSVQAKSQGSATNHNASYKHTHPDDQNPLHPWSGLVMGAFKTVRSARGWNDHPSPDIMFHVKRAQNLTHCPRVGRRTPAVEPGDADPQQSGRLARPRRAFQAQTPRKLIASAPNERHTTRTDPTGLSPRSPGTPA
jgi:hypothetical protein